MLYISTHLLDVGVLSAEAGLPALRLLELGDDVGELLPDLVFRRRRDRLRKEKSKKAYFGESFNQKDLRNPKISQQGLSSKY